MCVISNTGILPFKSPSFIVPVSFTQDRFSKFEISLYSQRNPTTTVC